MAAKRKKGMTAKENKANNKAANRRMTPAEKEVMRGAIERSLAKEGQMPDRIERLTKRLAKLGPRPANA